MVKNAFGLSKNQVACSGGPDHFDHRHGWPSGLAATVEIQSQLGEDPMMHS